MLLVRFEKLKIEAISHYSHLRIKRFHIAIFFGGRSIMCENSEISTAGDKKDVDSYAYCLHNMMRTMTIKQHNKAHKTHVTHCESVCLCEIDNPHPIAPLIHHSPQTRSEIPHLPPMLYLIVPFCSYLISVGHAVLSATLIHTIQPLSVAGSHKGTFIYFRMSVLSLFYIL